MSHGVRRTLTATATVAVLVLGAACSGDSSSADPRKESSSSSAASGSTASPTIEDEHAVPPPGPRGPGVVAPADFLVTLPDTADEELVKAVEGVRGITSVTVISLSEAVIENQALTVAAVDAGTYRTFVPQTSADFQQAWDRVAGGELALKKRLRSKVPVDPEGYLKLGTATDAPSVHVGAYVAQQPLIDAVVNDTWVDTLGMKRDNAMLIRTGRAAPGKVRHRLEKVLGPDAAVTPVDKASRIGLDPGAPQVAVVTGTVADAVGVFKYTVLGRGRIAPDPAWVRDHITTEVVPILGVVTCNKLIFPQLRAALQEIHERGLDDKIHPDEYAGCYYPRFIAGTSTLSNHAFGLALDLNVPGNQRGTVGEMDRGVVEAFKHWGFAWGGDWGYTDPMHFEMAELVSPGG
jgi:hypothetical protein